MVTAFPRSGPKNRSISSTTAFPAFSMRRRLGMFRVSMAARSSSRISAAVTNSIAYLRSSFISRTARSRPTETAWAMMLWPMLYSTISGMVRRRRTFR